MYKIFLSFLPWIILGTAIMLSIISTKGSSYSYLTIILMVFGPGIISFISGILVLFNKINKIYSLTIIIGSSIWVLIYMKADIGFWRYDGSLKVFIEIIKECLILMPLTYFYLGYFLFKFGKFFIKK